VSRLDANELVVDLLSRGHAVRFQARGDSMHPAIHDDDYLHAEPIDRNSPLRRGEVVVTLAERGLTVHRVLSHRGAVVQTRGDNAPGIDPPLDRTRVIGRIVQVECGGATRTLPRTLFLRLFAEKRAAARRILRRWLRR
jgi:hypothetical protein